MCTKAGGVFCATCTKKLGFVQFAQKCMRVFVQNAENAILGNSALCTKAFPIVENFCALCTNPNSACDVPPRAAEQSFDFARGKRKNASLGVSFSGHSRLAPTCPEIVPLWEAVCCRGGQPAEPVALFRNCQLNAGADYSFLGASFPYCTYIIPYTWRFVKPFLKNF